MQRQITVVKENCQQIRQEKLNSLSVFSVWQLAKCSFAVTDLAQ